MPIRLHDSQPIKEWEASPGCTVRYHERRNGDIIRAIRATARSGAPSQDLVAADMDLIARSVVDFSGLETSAGVALPWPESIEDRIQILEGLPDEFFFPLRERIFARVTEATASGKD